MLFQGLFKGRVCLCMTLAQRCAGTNTRAESRDYYQVLGVERTATLTEIKNAFFMQSKKLHPDSDPSNPLLHSQFVRLSEAYKVLSSDSSRMQYDKLLEALKREHWVPGTVSSFYSERGPSSRSTSDDNAYYWSQFSGQTEVPNDQRKTRNSRLVLYCILLMTGSMIVHYLGFSVLRKVQKEYVEEQQQRLMKIYNEAKMAARNNDVKKKQEIFLQKQAEFLKRYHGENQANETKK
ncbi:dnaJ homolog subfamily C member 4 [Pelodytes ibericus]